MFRGNCLARFLRSPAAAFGSSVSSGRQSGLSLAAMNDLEPELDALKAEHRQLDEKLQQLCAEPIGDQLEIARLKRRKLLLKDQIQLLIDSSVPDIIA